QRDGGLACLLDGVVERRIAVRVAAAGTRGHLDVLDQFREELAPLGVDDGLLVLGRRPLGVATHAAVFLTMSQKYAWMRPSAVSSGWNDVASRLPWRTATILPAVPSGAALLTRPRAVTSGPSSCTHGAR